MSPKLFTKCDFFPELFINLSRTIYKCPPELFVNSCQMLSNLLAISSFKRVSDSEDFLGVSKQSLFISRLQSHRLSFATYIWLVVWTPLKNISQLGWLFPINGKIKNVPNHQPVYVWNQVTFASRWPAWWHYILGVKEKTQRFRVPFRCCKAECWLLAGQWRYHGSVMFVKVIAVCGKEGKRIHVKHKRLNSQLYHFSCSAVLYVDAACT